MKVLFVNPPVIRSEHSSPENDFKIDGFIFKPKYKKIPGLMQLITMLHKYCGLGKGVRYGVRAGSRWPWTISRPTEGSPNYPFFMGYAASLVKGDGHDVRLIDSVADEVYSYEEFLDQVRKESPDLIIYECYKPTIDIDLWLTKQLKMIADVAVSGPHF